MLIRILAIAFAAAPLITVEAEQIVLIGDSLSEYSKQTVASFCDTAVVTNRGQGGSTAEQWVTADEDSDMYIPNAVKIKAGGECFPVIFVSLGGNDQLESKCMLEASKVENLITAALQKITKACPNAKIYMVGYPTPRKDFEECAITNGKGTDESLNAPVKAACDASSQCTYDAATDVGGGTDSTPSTGEYHEDNIHFNERGYCVLWNRDSFRTLMSCKGEKTDCSMKTTMAATTTKATITTEVKVQMEEGAMAGVALSAMALLATLAL